MLKDLEKLVTDHQREEEKTSTDDLVNTPKHTVHGKPYLTSVDSLLPVTGRKKKSFGTKRV
jgi:hypothetical protein